MYSKSLSFISVLLCFCFVSSLASNRPTYNDESSVYNFIEIDTQNKAASENEIKVEYGGIKLLLANNLQTKLTIILPCRKELSCDYIYLIKDKYLSSVPPPPPDCV